MTKLNWERVRNWDRVRGDLSEVELADEREERWFALDNAREESKELQRKDRRNKQAGVLGRTRQAGAPSAADRVKAKPRLNVTKGSEANEKAKNSKAKAKPDRVAQGSAGRGGSVARTPPWKEQFRATAAHRGPSGQRRAPTAATDRAIAARTATKSARLSAAIGVTTAQLKAARRAENEASTGLHRLDGNGRLAAAAKRLGITTAELQLLRRGFAGTTVTKEVRSVVRTVAARAGVDPSGPVSERDRSSANVAGVQKIPSDVNRAARGVFVMDGRRYDYDDWREGPSY